MNNFGEWKAAVLSAIARSDVPAYVYALATAEINARLRLVEMETTTTLATVASAESVALPAEFLEARHAYVDTDPRAPLDNVTEWALSSEHRETGVPREYFISTAMHLNPVPDAVYSINLRYVGALDAFTDDNDTNTVLVRYPGIYLYAGLKHAAVWAQDAELAQGYASMLEGEINRARKAAIMQRYAGPLRRRAVATP